MIELTPSLWNVTPYEHQVEGVKRLVSDSDFALFDEMGAGKSKQVVDAACALADAGRLRTVVVLAPANVRSVWLKRDENASLDGEIHKHAWRSMGHRVFEFHSKRRKTRWRAAWKERWSDDDSSGLTWVVSNYEMVRGEGIVDNIRQAAKTGPSMLVLDESSYLINHASNQWRAVRALRKWFDRVVLLNGTPTNNNPLDLWGQFEIMDPKVFGRKYENFYKFRWRFAVMAPQVVGGRTFAKVVGFQNMDEFRSLIAPHALRRLKIDCLDLPPKIYTTREVALSKETWRKYDELRRDAIVALGNGDLQVESNAAVRLLRLAQLTSGHIGRTVTEHVVAESVDSLFDDLLDDIVESKTLDVGDEKLTWCVKYILEEHGRPPAVMLGQPQAGGLGISLTAADTVIYLSNLYSLIKRQQSEDRTDRPGPTGKSVVVWCRWRRERERLAAMLRAHYVTVFEIHGGQTKTQRDKAKEDFQLTATSTKKRSVTYVDVLATGPAGQKTIDHSVVRALKTKEELARRTAAAWRKELVDEEGEPCE